jgi:hypothetical protein
MAAYQNLSGDSKRFYSGHVTKLNRKNRPNARIIVLGDRNLYRLDTNFVLTRKGPVDYEEIVGMSVTPGNEQALVIHCSVRYGSQLHNLMEFLFLLPHAHSSFSSSHIFPLPPLPPFLLPPLPP